MEKISKRILVIIVLLVLIFFFFKKKTTFYIQNSTNQAINIEIIIDGQIIDDYQVFPSSKSKELFNLSLNSGMRGVRINVKEGDLIVMEDSFAFFVLFRQWCYINVEPSQEVYTKSRMIRFSNSFYPR